MDIRRRAMMGRHDDDGWELIHHWSAEQGTVLLGGTLNDLVRDVPDIGPIDFKAFGGDFSQVTGSKGAYLRASANGAYFQTVENNQPWGRNFKVVCKVGLRETQTKLNAGIIFDKCAIGPSVRGVALSQAYTPNVFFTLKLDGNESGPSNAGQNGVFSGDYSPPLVTIWTLEVYSDGQRTGAVATIRDTEGHLLFSRDWGYWIARSIDFGGEDGWQSGDIRLLCGMAGTAYTPSSPMDIYDVKILRTDKLRQNNNV